MLILLVGHFTKEEIVHEEVYNHIFIPLLYVIEGEMMLFHGNILEKIMWYSEYVYNAKLLTIWQNLYTFQLFQVSGRLQGYNTNFILLECIYNTYIYKILIITDIHINLLYLKTNYIYLINIRTVFIFSLYLLFIPICVFVFIFIINI